MLCGCGCGLRCGAWTSRSTGSCWWAGHVTARYASGGCATARSSAGSRRTSLCSARESATRRTFWSRWATNSAAESWLWCRSFARDRGAPGPSARARVRTRSRACTRSTQLTHRAPVPLPTRAGPLALLAALGSPRLSRRSSSRRSTSALETPFQDHFQPTWNPLRPQFSFSSFIYTCISHPLCLEVRYASINSYSLYYANSYILIQIIMHIHSIRSWISLAFLYLIQQFFVFVPCTFCHFEYSLFAV